MKEIIDHIKAIAEAKTKVVKLELTDDGAKLSSNLIFSLMSGLGLFLITVLLSIVILTSLSVYFDSYIIGSAITFSIFTVSLGLCYIFLKDKIKQSLTNKVYQNVIDKKINSNQKFEAVKKIEDLKIKYHETEVLNKVETMITNIEHSTNTVTSIAHLIKDS